ncbi:hypothetical protein STAFG_6961 [Streptomyces afghaniensis 772]|uniref:Uncharacterized protein n=1 Tax=Streptomyces afghaniensis 772 TaxID=1283301 RepID=S4MHH4_9ACTN|nr:hypothetical protein STAFG_6961 [Streptomyces afghaniensis 772]
MRTEVSPAAAASLVCMSMQTAQPLIWLTRSETSSRVAAGSGDSTTSRPRDMNCFMTLPALGMAKTSRRAFMVNSCVVVDAYALMSRRPGPM